jgi:hypothetical protein
MSGTNNITITGASVNTLTESAGSDSVSLSGGSANTLNLIGPNSVAVVGPSTNTMNLTGTTGVSLQAASVNTFNVTGSTSNTTFTIGTATVSALAIFTGTSNGTSTLSLTGDGSGNTYQASGMAGFPGVVTLNDTNRNQGPPPPADVITLVGVIGDNINMVPDGSGGTDINEQLGTLDILGSQPQDSTTILAPHKPFNRPILRSRRTRRPPSRTAPISPCSTPRSSLAHSFHLFTINRRQFLWLLT